MAIAGCQVGVTVRNRLRAAWAGIAVLLLLVACQSQPPSLPTPQPRPTAPARETWPSSQIWVEGTGSTFLTLSRDELPINLTLTGENAWAWLVLYEQGSEIRSFSMPQVAGRESILRIVSLDLQDVIPLRIEVEGPWRVIKSYLDRGNFMELPGRMSGSGPHLVYFSVGEPRYVRIEAEPGEGIFALYAIGGEPSSGAITATTRHVSEVYPLSPELMGLEIRTGWTWTIHVVDRADILE